MQLGFSTLGNAAAPEGGAAVADGEPPVDEPAEIDSTVDPLAAAASGADLAATALNGAQVTALLEVLNQIAAGTIDKDAAVALITAAFPTITEALASQMVDGTNPTPPQAGVQDNGT
jgi:hypothetical protein